MAKSKQAKGAMPYVRRLAEDEYVQRHLRNATTRLGDAYGRVSRKRGRAVEDKKLYDQLREAATSARKGALALRGRPPEPPKRKGRKLVLVAVAGGAAVLVARKRARDKPQAPPSAAAETDASGPATGQPTAAAEPPGGG
jgi:hypothetical protein